MKLNKPLMIIDNLHGLLKQLLIATLVLSSIITFAQNFSYPKIAPQGKEINAFIPDGWALLDSTQGDLNKDGHDDLAIILQHKDSVALIKKVTNVEETVLTQPKILLILFYDMPTNQYEVKEQNNSFILNHDNANMEEPFIDIAISNAVMKIDFQIFMNMGSWDMATYSYKFRYQDNVFAFIGADYSNVNRGSGDTEERSYNFLTKKVQISKGNIESVKSKITNRKFHLKAIKTLKTFKQPFSWQVEKDFYL